MARRAYVPNIMPTITGPFFAIPTEIVSRPFAIDSFKNAPEPEFLLHSKPRPAMSALAVDDGGDECRHLRFQGYGRLLIVGR